MHRQRNFLLFIALAAAVAPPSGRRSEKMDADQLQLLLSGMKRRSSRARRMRTRLRTAYGRRLLRIRTGPACTKQAGEIEAEMAHALNATTEGLITHAASRNSGGTYTDAGHGVQTSEYTIQAGRNDRH